RTIGFPTANIHPDESYKLIPQNGVYVVRASYKDWVFNGMLNIGVRPTVDGTSKTIEVNILDFDREIYGEEVKLELLHYLRPEQKFNGLPELIAQINVDKQATIDYFAGLN
ncbi:MAG TPA: riboflavin kinase, partial [Dyadobacter sp.]|nr:riboflavin kinase [Dyadobacter sp.]